MSDPQAAELIRDTYGAYQSLVSYEDMGTVTHLRGGTTTGFPTAFETLFLKPSFFRFKCWDRHRYPALAPGVTTSVSGFDGSIAYSWCRVDRQEPQVVFIPRLSLAVARTGVGGLAAQVLCELLLQTQSRHGVLDLLDLTLARDETIEGQRCMGVRGLRRQPFISSPEHEPSEPQEIVVFIDPIGLLVRRVRIAGTFEVNHLNIRLNPRIDEGQFAVPA